MYLIGFGSIVEGGVSAVVAELSGGDLVGLEAVVERPTEVSRDRKSSHPAQNLFVLIINFYSRINNLLY